MESIKDEKFKSIIINFPLQGEWVFLRPYGHNKNAFDFVKTNETRKKYSTGGLLNYLFYKIPVENFYCWSKPIFAPVGGVVVQIGNDWQDNKSVSFISTIELLTGDVWTMVKNNIPKKKDVIRF